MALVFLIAAVARARAPGGIPVVLPPRESAAEWQSALSLGGLVAGEEGPGPSVVMEVRGDAWQVRMHLGSGEVRTFRVVPPRTQQGREDLVWLVVSLLREGESKAAEPTPAASTPTGSQEAEREAGNATSRHRALSPPPPDPGSPVPVAPEAIPERPTPSPEAPPAVDVAVPPPDPESFRTEAPLEASAAVVERADRVRLWLHAGPSLQLRTGQAGSAAFAVDGGVTLEGGVRLGAGAVAEPAAALVAVGPNDTMSALGAYAGAWWRVPGRAEVEVGLLAGASSRRFHADGDPVDNGLVPLAAFDALVSMPVTEHIQLAPRATLQRDLRTTQLWEGNEPRDDLSPWLYRAGVHVALGLPARADPVQ